MCPCRFVNHSEETFIVVGTGDLPLYLSCHISSTHHIYAPINTPSLSWAQVTFLSISLPLIPDPTNTPYLCTYQSIISTQLLSSFQYTLYHPLHLPFPPLFTTLSTHPFPHDSLQSSQRPGFASPKSRRLFPPRLPDPRRAIAIGPSDRHRRRPIGDV